MKNIEYIKKEFLKQAKELEEGEAFTLSALRAFIESAKEYKGNAIKVAMIDCASTDNAVIQIIQPDKPFLVNSILNYLRRRDLMAKRLLHPVLNDFENKHYTGPVSAITIELERPLERFEEKEIVEEINHLMREVSFVANDFEVMREAVLQTVRALDLKKHEKRSDKDFNQKMGDARASLLWVLDDKFIFLGITKVKLNDKNIKFTKKQGIFSSNFKAYKNELTSILQACIKNKKLIPDPMTLDKSASISPVHRNSWMDLLIISPPVSNEKDRELIFIYGLWTSVAARSDIANIPFFAVKIQQLRESLGLKRDGRESFFRHNLSLYPWEGLERLSSSERITVFKRILKLQVLPKPMVTRHRHRYLEREQVFIVIPRDRYSETVRERIFSKLAERYNANLISWRVNISEDQFARLVGDFDYPDGLPKKDVNQVEDERIVLELIRSWSDTVTRLTMARNSINIDFPESYQVTRTPQEAVRDSEIIGNAEKNGFAFGIDFGARNKQVSLKLAIRGEAKPLSHVLPMLERCAFFVDSEDGFRVVAKVREEAKKGDSKKQKVNEVVMSLMCFDLNTQAYDKNQLNSIHNNAHLLLETLAMVYGERVEDDDFNALSWSAGINPKQIELLRSIASWVRQSSPNFEFISIARLLAREPSVACNLVDFFTAIHAPQKKEATSSFLNLETTRGWHKEILDQKLLSIQNQYDDKLIRFLFNSFNAIVRTNYFVKDDADPLVIKFNSKSIEGLVEPRPYREIYVYHKQYEAVHLRFGPIARGGIRWSDRPSDFRFEVLDLAKAQQVKNSAIVPVGAKGGFVLKQESDDIASYAIDSYKKFITGMLSITDNRVGDRVEAPKDIVCIDGNDSYHVVAADKGTASFSDYANKISVDNKFWLDDAFASGGTNGYDHKKMGITAKGAWESIKRHFMEIGINPEKDKIKVVGVGDMSGDVFGNGMLLSKSILLIAAFNHRNIFIDPNPDPEVSFKARAGLFKKAKSTWQDYPKDALSPDAVIFDRSKKRVTLNAKIKHFLGIDSDQVEPDAIIKKLLCLDSDLLWFGGIGTYIKSRDESDIDAKDSSNNNVRVNADQIKAKVIGEGANLAMTQKARISYAHNGGLINTDSVDNAGGVSCSDLEVNIKILLSAIEKKGKIKREARNKLLATCTDEVSTLVTDAAYERSLAISHWYKFSAANLVNHRMLMRLLESKAGLDRRLEVLPDASEIERRLRQGIGFSRPELAILQAYAKNYAVQMALKEKWDPIFDVLKQYFPNKLFAITKDSLLSHPLAREIVATELINDCLHHTSIDFLEKLKERISASHSELLFAYFAIKEVFLLGNLWDDWRDQEENWVGDAHLSLIEASSRLIQDVIPFFVNILRTKPLDDVIKDCRFAIDKFSPIAINVDAPSLHQGIDTLCETLKVKGIDSVSADQMRIIYYAKSVCMVLRAAYKYGKPVTSTLLVNYFSSGEKYGLLQLYDRFYTRDRVGSYEDEASEIIMEKIMEIHSDLAILLTKNEIEEIPDSDVSEDYLSRINEFNVAVDVSAGILTLWKVQIEELYLAAKSALKA